MHKSGIRFQNKTQSPQLGDDAHVIKTDAHAAFLFYDFAIKKHIEQRFDEKKNDEYKKNF